MRASTAVSLFGAGVAAALHVPAVLHAQERDLEGDRPITVRVHVTAAKITGDTTTLGYTVDNLRSGDEDLTEFFVTVTAPVITMPAPKSGHWFTDPRYNNKRIAMWALYHSALLPPGESTPELVLVARGLPDLAHYWGTPNLMAHPVDIDDDPDRDDDLHFADTGTTVGIVPVPARATPASLARRLSRLVVRACGSLGWIDQPGVCNSIGVELKHAQVALTTGNTERARDALEALAAELDAKHGDPSGKHVSDEAYALLHPNVMFLLGRV